MEHVKTWSGHDIAGDSDGQAWAMTPELESFVSGWQKFLDHLVDLDVYDAPTVKGLVDGCLLTESLGVKPGRWMGKALDVCMAWQLRNPRETDARGAIEEVRRRRDEVGIPAAK
ncbi:trna nucleotidyltransferase [Lasius niger]|uniref:Trna nucleotidyltransferase n=1 Tax=Lasius niger TaxID=67767 RepID=A0A0J7JTB0_LASNI|nr:trna nucleotidyltransferase [Lasius niger]